MSCGLVFTNGGLVLSWSSSPCPNGELASDYHVASDALYAPITDKDFQASDRSLRWCSNICKCETGGYF